MEDTALTIALEARDKAATAEHRIDTHEQVCAERYSAIRGDVSELKAFVKKGVFSLIAMLFAVCGTLIWNVFSRHP